MKIPISLVFAAMLTASSAAAVVGCAKSAPPSARAGGNKAEGIALADIDAAGLTQAVERHHGKVVLVDFWATWCGSCRTLFPHTVDLHNRFSADGLAVIAVSLNKPEDRKEVAAFLEEHNATTENYLNSLDSDAQALAAFRIPEGIPYLQIYDREGRLFREISGNEPEKIEKAVTEVLARSKPN